MRRLISAALAASVLVGAPAAYAAPGVLFIIPMQRRADQVGDKYSFSAETRTRTEANGKVHDSGDRQDFDLEILKAGSEGLVVSYVQTGGETFDPADTADAATGKAWIGLKVVFETDPNGYPRRVVNLDEVKTQYLAALAQIAPNDERLRSHVVELFETTPPEVLAADAIGNHLRTLSGMQVRVLNQPGHTDLPSEEQKDPDGSSVKVRHTLDVGNFGPCRAALERASWTERPGGLTAPSSRLDTKGELSTYDGWMIDLTEVDTVKVPQGQRVQTVKISRRSKVECKP